MIELYLSSDGKHTVHVSAESIEQMNDLSTYAHTLYTEVLEKFGTKAQMWEAARNGQSPAKRNDKVATTPEAVASRGLPQCLEHNSPMRYRRGRYGDFWSCPTKRPDGTWCTHTQPVVSPTNGHLVQQMRP